MSGEYRRRPRRELSTPVPVVDAMTGETVGHVGNLSESGMLLLANRALVDDALYQVRFRLPATGGEAHDFEVGAHVLWTDADATGTRAWTGLRFIAVPDAQARRLHAWIVEGARAD